MIFMLILCNVVQKQCSHVVVQYEAGSVKSKIYGEPVDNCLENPLVPSLK